MVPTALKRDAEEAVKKSRETVPLQRPKFQGIEPNRWGIGA